MWFAIYQVTETKGKGENMAKGVGLTSTMANILVAEVMSQIKKVGHVQEIVVCGSLRRKKPIVKDVDLAIFTDSENYDEVWDSVPHDVKWETRGTISRRWYYKEIKIDARIFKPLHRGAALLTRTGSAKLNVVMRGIAKKQGFLLNEYGIHKDGRNLSAGWSEKQIFLFLGLKYLEPEQRSEPSMEKKQVEWIVPSKSGNGDHKVMQVEGHLQCDCMGYKYRRTCWHVEHVLTLS
jgi:DNA polymerase/3'-5' exonuclease PolX